MGKSFVRQHAHDIDTQKVWEKLTNHMKLSTKSAIERRELQQYVCTAVYDSSSLETTHAFVFHFNEQFCRHDNITEHAHQIPYPNRLTLLQHAVSKVPELRMVETMEEFRLVETMEEFCLVVSNQDSKAQPHLQYSTYFDLLISACIKHDKAIENKPKSRTRNIYAHQVEDIPLTNKDDFQPYLQSGPMDGGINLSPIDYMQVTTAQQQQRPESSNRSPSSRSSTDSIIKKRYDGPIFLTSEIYITLSDKQKEALKKYNEKAMSRSRQSPRGAMVHEESPTSQETGSDQITSEPDLDNSPHQDDQDGQSPMSDQSIEDIMHVFQAQLNFEGHQRVNMLQRYHISQAQASKFGCLVDRGANGGLAGSDV
ncbi:hypothetical protein ACA910_006493 [Epithemia clementina (nom. ined.)]